MKYKITKKLIFYFAIVLLLFSLVIGLLFIMLFTYHTTHLHQEELEQQAKIIAENFTEYKQYGVYGKDNSKAGYAAYIKFLNHISIGNIWMVDKDAELIQIGFGEDVVSYSDLPNDAISVIQNVFDGQCVYSENFSSFLGTATVTAGAPVYNSSHQVISAVLLHTSVKGIDNAIGGGISILIISLAIALTAAVGLSIWLSIRFIKPLKSMEHTAGLLTKGDYSVQTGIDQKDEIGSLANKLDTLAIHLKEASLKSSKLEKLRKDFISNISHELRTPVAVIRGSLEVLYDEVITDKEKVKEYYKQMLGDTLHLERLINDLLELSRLQNMDFAIEMEEVNVIDILTDSIRSSRMVAREKRIEIILTTKLAEIYFFGDYVRLRQMFMVVLDNAIKFSKRGSVIDILLYKKENKDIITITDYGIGILEEHLPHIFERFYHVRSEENKSGTGLGLSIAKQIAIRHNIELTCISEPNVKTIFSFIFPSREELHST